MPPLWKAPVSSTPPAGVELPAESVAPVPSRTWLCDSRTFKRLQATGRSNFVISPVGLLASFTYSLANVTDLTYTAFVVALSVAFNDNGMSMDAGAGTCWLTIADLVGSIIYLIDLWMGFQLGIIARWEGRAVVVQNWAASARFYTRCGTFWTDMLACLPIFAQVAVATTGSSAQLLRLIATLRLLRLIRVVRLLANLSRSSVGGSHMRVLASAVTSRKLLLLHAVFSLAVLVNLLGCIWWNVAVGEGLDNSWAAAVNKDFDLLTAGEPTQWLVSCYFALTTIVTVGGCGDWTASAAQRLRTRMRYAPCAKWQAQLFSNLPQHPALHADLLPSTCSAGYGDIVPATVKEVAMCWNTFKPR
jgi:hypothetical protein